MAELTDDMTLKIPDHILLREANIENGKLKAYIVELEDKIERMKVDALTELDVDVEWLKSLRPKEYELKKEVLRLARIISGSKAGLQKRVQQLEKKLSVFESCGNIDDVMSAIKNQKALAKRVKVLEQENANFKKLLN